MNQSEIAERAAREIHDRFAGGCVPEKCDLVIDIQGIVERAIAESQAPQPETNLYPLLESIKRHFLSHLPKDEASRAIFAMEAAEQNWRELGDGEPSSAPPAKFVSWNAEDYRKAADVHAIAEKIIRRVVANVLEIAHTRHSLDDVADSDPIEQADFVADGLGLALGEDTGCLDPADLSAENCEVLFVEQELREILKRGESGAAQEVSPKLLSAEQIAQKLANVGGIERWRVILQEWLDSYIAIWKQEEILWRTMVAEGDTRELKAALRRALPLMKDMHQNRYHAFKNEVEDWIAETERLLG